MASTRGRAGRSSWAAHPRAIALAQGDRGTQGRRRCRNRRAAQASSGAATRGCVPAARPATYHNRQSRPAPARAWHTAPHATPSWPSGAEVRHGSRPTSSPYAPSLGTDRARTTAAPLRPREFRVLDGRFTTTTQSRLRTWSPRQPLRPLGPTSAGALLQPAQWLAPWPLPLCDPMDRRRRRAGSQRARRRRWPPRRARSWPCPPGADVSSSHQRLRRQRACEPRFRGRNASLRRTGSLAPPVRACPRAQCGSAPSRRRRLRARPQGPRDQTACTRVCVARRLKKKKRGHKNCETTRQNTRGWIRGGHVRCATNCLARLTRRPLALYTRTPASPTRNRPRAVPARRQRTRTRPMHASVSLLVIATGVPHRDIPVRAIHLRRRSGQSTCRRH